MSPLKGRSRQSACKAINFYNRFSKAIGLRFKKLPATKVDKELQAEEGLDGEHIFKSRDPEACHTT